MLRIRAIRLFVATVVLAVPLTLPAAQGLAGATPPPGQGGWTGTGTISPGLPTSGCVDNSSMSMTGTAVLAGGATSGALSVRFDGNSTICESLNAGQGSGTLSGDLTGHLSYTRTGNVMTMSGIADGTAAGAAFEMPRPIVVICILVYLSIGPITGFVFICIII